jgi:EpsI family protein
VNSERVQNALVFALLLLVGAAAWWLTLRPGLVVDAARLESLPREIEHWRAEDVPLGDTVEAELRADANLQRVWLHANAEPIWMYVGYYGTQRGGRPEHTPRGCYSGAGYGIEATRVVEVDLDRGLRVNEYVVEREGERQLVHFWYQSNRRTGLLGGIDQNLDRLVGRLGEGRADGALIRLSTRLLDGDETGARSRLIAFGAVLDPMLAERWPEETAAR